ncbi:MAG TPA: ROK family transcriptional regulator [Candidatus Sulfotelmatobacter sp.]|nr:ROK family transcriptional regulator [Candidatus Sulfotelmatobacter sp.]
MNKEPVLVARPPLLRQTNAQLLLRLLRESGPCSKADLVRASGLSAPTVTNVVAHLASVGLIEPVGEGDSTGGRPPDIIRFRAERGCVAGLEIASDAVLFLLTDLDGHELARANTAISWNSSKPSAICSQITKELRSLIRRQKHAEEQLLGVAVGVPAIVNVDEGTVLALSSLKAWNHVPLRSMLSRDLKCQVTIDNDTNLAALGEYNRGAAQGESNFVFITIGEGVGAGIFLDGKIYRGSQWSAGEIGYLRVPHIAREHPTIHEYGRLEKVLGASGILRSWHAASKQGRSKSKPARPADVFNLAIDGNARAKKILLHRATILSDIILDLALILNPSLILLGGEVGGHPRLLQEVNALLKGSEFAVVRVLPGALGTSAVLWGAVHVAMESALLSLLQPPD